MKRRRPHHCYRLESTIPASPEEYAWRARMASAMSGLWQEFQRPELLEFERRCRLTPLIEETFRTRPYSWQVTPQEALTIGFSLIESFDGTPREQQ